MAGLASLSSIAATALGGVSATIDNKIIRDAETAAGNQAVQLIESSSVGSNVNSLA